MEAARILKPGARLAFKNLARLCPFRRQKESGRVPWTHTPLPRKGEPWDPCVPPEVVRVLRVIEDVFSERVWDWVRVLVVGAILTPGQRTVAAVLRVMGLSDERQYQNFHRVLNRARWSSRELSRRLLVLLVLV